MAIFPRPVSPKSAAGDLWGYLLEKRNHRWPLLGVSAALTWVIIWVFMIDANTNTMPKQNKILYFENWRADRSDIAVILQQKQDLADRVEAIHASQKEMRKVADVFGIEWREEAKREAAREAEAVRILNARLDKKLAEARARVIAGQIDPSAGPEITAHKSMKLEAGKPPNAPEPPSPAPSPAP